MLLLHVLFLAIGAASAATAATSKLASRDAPLLKPDRDEFYQTPAGFESKPPGAILRKRAVPYPIDATLEGAPVGYASAHQVLYRTTDSFGKAIATVIEEAANLGCAPSYTLQQGAEQKTHLDDLLAGLQSGSINDALKKDANNPAGYATLDGIRATLASSSFTSISAHATSLIWGYSSGSLSGGFAAELQPKYAPELNLAGAALGGTIPDILNALLTVNKGFYAGIIAIGIIGLKNEYPKIASLIESQLVPSKADALGLAKKQCLGGAIQSFQNQDIFDYVKDRTIFNSTQVKEVLDANNMSHAAPSIPLLIYKAGSDETSPATDTDRLVQFYCKQKTSVEYVHVSGAEHLSLLTDSAPRASAWLKSRFDGLVKEGCTTSATL
ncbi:hypothetical protein EsHS_00006093 [Epichloe bromicola]